MDSIPWVRCASGNVFHDLTQITQRRVCFNPKRTEKPKAHGFSVRFGLKAHSAQGGRGVNRKHHPAEGEVQKCTGQKCTEHELVLCLFFNVLSP